ncbi:hypothetical protein T439DRAFT_320523 [Meredithblackwellia eburnea MCA 4105]
MATGSLVSNSPFARRLGTVANSTTTTSSSSASASVPTPSPATTLPRSLYSTSRIPTTSAATGIQSQSKTSGSRSSSVESFQTKENIHSSIPNSSSNSSLNGPSSTSASAASSADQQQHPSLNLNLSISNSPLLALSDNESATNSPSIQFSAKKEIQSSPSVPFRPVRNHHVASSSTTTTPVSQIPSRIGSLPPQFNQDHPRRASPSFAAVRNNGLVSSSPFTSSSSSGSGLRNTTPRPTAPVAGSTINKGSDYSPPLAQAPYEIPPLSQEGAPFYPGRSGIGALAAARHSDDDDDEGHGTIRDHRQLKKGGVAELGVRRGPSTAASAALSPGAASGGDRRIYGGSTHPPPQTPPRDGTSSSSQQPSSSALSPSRRGIKGPRAPYHSDYYEQDSGSEISSVPGTGVGGGDNHTDVSVYSSQAGDEDDYDKNDLSSSTRTLRRQPSAKTVTWAETEEVLEFEVDEEERSRLSLASSSSSTGSEGEESIEGSEGYEDRLPLEGDGEEEGNGSMVFLDEGGSVEVHDLEEEDDDDSYVESEDESAVSTASTVEDVIGEIDSFIADDVFGRAAQIMNEERGYRTATRGNGALVHLQQQSSKQHLGGPSSTFSSASSSSGSGASSDVSSSVSGSRGRRMDEDATSESSYDDEEELAQASKAHAALDDAERTFQLASPPFVAVAVMPRTNVNVKTTGMTQSSSQYSLPDLPENSPFIAFEDDGAASSVVSMDLNKPAPASAAPAPSSSTPRPTVAAPAPIPSPTHRGTLTPTAATSSSTSPVRLLPTSPPLQSTPTIISRSLRAATAGDSPILSAFGSSSSSSPVVHSPSPSPSTSHNNNAPTPASPESQLSRQASLVGSDVSESYRASLRGGGGSRFAANREKFEEKMRREQALLEGLASPRGTDVSVMSPNLSRFPDPPSHSTGTGVRSSPFGAIGGSGKSATPTQALRPTVLTLPPTPPGSIAIAARPAVNSPTKLNPSSLAMVSSTTTTTSSSSSSPSTESSPHNLESPLDRLSREVAVSSQGELELLNPNLATSSSGTMGMGRGALLRTSTSNGSIASVASASSSAIMVAERKTVGLGVGVELGSKKESLKGKGRPKGRRSLSTGDVNEGLKKVSSESTPMEKISTMPEFGSLVQLDQIALAGPGFATGLQSSLDDIYRHRNASYRVRESKTVVYANDGEVATVGPAGDIDAGRAWRKKRPSDWNLPSLQSTKSVSTTKSVNRTSGQTYVRLIEFVFKQESYPVPSARTIVQCLVSNSAAPIMVGEFTLGTTININKEFELMGSNPLDIYLQVPVSQAKNAHLLPASAPAPPKSPSRLRSVFSSPKKRAVSATPPVPDRILQYMGTDSVFVKTQLTPGSHYAQCRGKPIRLILPIQTRPNSSQKLAAGSLVIDLLWIPPLGAVPSLPRSMAEVQDGLVKAELESKVIQQGILTQLGGDCTTRRRRLFKLLGHRLIPYSEVTKRAFVEIDLSLATALYDPNQPSTSSPLALAKSPKSPASGMTRSSSMDLEEQRWTAQDHAFTIVFGDGSDIAFIADTAEDKEKWISVLVDRVGKRAAKKPVPEWAVKLRKQMMATPTAAVASSATSSSSSASSTSGSTSGTSPALSQGAQSTRSDNSSGKVQSPMA